MPVQLTTSSDIGTTASCNSGRNWTPAIRSAHSLQVHTILLIEQIDWLGWRDTDTMQLVCEITKHLLAISWQFCCSLPLRLPSLLQPMTMCPHANPGQRLTFPIHTSPIPGFSSLHGFHSVRAWEVLSTNPGACFTKLTVPA